MSHRVKSSFKKHVIEGLTGGKEIVFYHNLPNTFGLSIDGAVMNWAMRTNKYTLESFAKYVASKGIGHEILSPEQYNKLPVYASNKKKGQQKNL